MAEIYAGLMSGTSMDAIDAALVDFAAPHAPFRLLATHSLSLPAGLRARLRELAHAPVRLVELAELDVTLGELFARAAMELLARHPIPLSAVRAIGSHGQTVFHAPGEQAPSSLQLGDPNIIAERTGLTTVADFRRRDIAAGGQGAPLVPAFHAALFRHGEEDRAVLNLGGIANLTLLPRDPAAPVRGFDTGPGNALMDAWIERHRGVPLDQNGDFARSGRLLSGLLGALLADPYFSQPPPKSTGKEYFHPGWLDTFLRALPAPPAAEDVQATLCELTAMSVAEALRHHAPSTRRLLVCGGGVHNSLLMERLAHQIENIPIESSATHGLDPRWVEAAAFAWLAKQTLEGRPGNLPAVTGARHPVVLGAIYPGKTTRAD